MPLKRRAAVTASLLVATSAGFLWLTHRDAGSPLAEATKNGGNSPPRKEAATTPRPQTITASPAAQNDWHIQLDGQAHSLTLALDEAVLRDADGKEALTRLVPAATRESLPARLASLSAPGGVFPVAYLSGLERSSSSRRILTRDLRVQLDDAAAQQIASRQGLTIKDRPTYAPGWVIMSAPDAFSALDAMTQLRKFREVSSADILLAVQHHTRALPNDALISNQWHLKRSGSAVAGSDVNIEPLWNYPAATGSRGKGIRIGIVDDGLQTSHPDFVGNIDTTNDKDWNGNDSDPSPGTDDDHGTACAGNAAARGNNSIGVAGSAPEATLVGMRLIGGSVTDAQEAEAMNYLPQLIEIKSNSWGPEDTGDILEGPGPLTLSALQTATSSGRGGKGSIILWAGGNGGTTSSGGDNSNYDGYANSIHTIAIGATDSTGKRASYSEPGSNIVVCAPSSGGLDITTVDRTGSAGYSTGDYANDFGGTSSATPTAAGIVALMLEKNPNLGWRDVQEILIRSAARPPAVPTTGWVTNPAGIPFHRDFGAGLIDASAAVNLSASWVNLPAQSSVTSTQSALNSPIPENNSTGVTRSFDLSSSNLRVEHVTLKLSANHTSRGNLEVTLSSPGGMSSKLAEVHSDATDNYANWTFSTVRNWGESSRGTWTLKIADLSGSGNTNGGTLTGAELKVFGSLAAPVNPPPVVQITQPTNGAIFSPGTPLDILVTATDLTAAGTPGSVSSIELFDNQNSLGSLSAAPYSFTFTPGLGNHSLVAKATDSEGALGSSVSVNFTVTNQAPLITAASLSASDQIYSDSPLTVSSITATDPEGASLSYTYQWQSSSNGSNYTDLPGATLATAPALTGRLLRCMITANDGNSDSPAFTTAAVNALARPSTLASPGDQYSYTSGLVLRGSDSPLARRAILHEFSQGPIGGAAEWVEILTLQAGSLANWQLQESSLSKLVFLNSPAWENIPAGTRIVIYNGTSKDPLLGPDDADPADGTLMLSSTNRNFFTSTSDPWISLSNSGDSISLIDANAITVHAISYGTNSSVTPNVGSVDSGKSAHYTGDTDSGANLAAQWRVTNSLNSRATKALRAPNDLFISEYIEGSGENKFLELYNPSLSTVNLATEGYKIEIYNNGVNSATTSIPLTGTIASNATFVIKHGSATASISAQLTTSSLAYNGDDALLLKKGSTLVDSIGQVGYDPGNAWTGGAGAVSTLNQTLRRKPVISQGDTNGLNVFDPSLEWDTYGLDNFSGLGSHTIDSANSTPSLTLVITPNRFAENAGSAAALGTVSTSPARLTDLVVSLLSSDPSEASVPASVTIPAGQTSASFAIAAVDDSEPDGPQDLSISASASGLTSASSTLTVTDDEVSLEGVTPGHPNTAANAIFVAALRDGSLSSPALFRIGVGTQLPSGLSLDTATGTLSGTLSPTNPAGDYPIVIERYNSLGESVSQSFTLTLLPGAPPGNSFAAWLASFSLGALNGFGDDFDGDGLANGLENFLGTAPDQPNPGLTQISRSPDSLIFRHTRSNTPADGLVASYEWSANLSDWNASATLSGGISITLTPTLIIDRAAPENDLIEVSATPSGDLPEKLFVRLKTTLSPAGEP